MFPRGSFGTTEVPEKYLQYLVLKDNATPADLLQWRKTCAQLLRTMCNGRISYIFENLQDPDVIGDLHREHEQVLERMVEKSRQPRGPVGPFRSHSRQALHAASLPKSPAGADLLDELTMLSAKTWRARNAEDPPTASGEEQGHGGDNDDAVSELDGEESVPSITGKSLSKLTAGMKELYEDEDFLNSLRHKMLQEAQEAERVLFICKTSVLNALLAGGNPCVGKGISGSIKAKHMSHVFEGRVAAADLTQILCWINHEVGLKGKTDMVPDLAYFKYQADYHAACVWSPKSTTLAQYLESVSVAKDTFTSQCTELGISRGQAVITATTIGIFLTNLEKDKSLHDFYAPYLHERKEIPFGGYESMRRDLIMWLEQRGKSADYGFRSSAASSAKDKDPSIGKPAVSSAKAATPAQATSRKSGGKDKTDFIPVCKYCLNEGHKSTECRKYEKAGKPELTSEQQEAFKRKIKELKERTSSAKSSGGKSATAKSAASQPKTSNTAKAAHTSDDDENSAQRVYFIRTANMLRVYTGNGQQNAGETVIAPNGEERNVGDLVQLDNGANCNLVLRGCELPLEDGRFNRNIVLSTAGGQSIGMEDYGCPLTPGMRWLMSNGTASCILSEFEVERLGGCVEYFDVNGVRRARAEITIDGVVIAFERHSNGLYYCKLLTLITALGRANAAATVPVPRNTANVSTRSGRGVDVTPKKKRVVTFKDAKVKGRGNHSSDDDLPDLVDTSDDEHDSDSDSSVPSLVPYSPESDSEDEWTTILQATPKLTKTRSDEAKPKHVAKREPESDSDVPDLVSGTDTDSDDDEPAIVRPKPAAVAEKQVHEATKGTAAGYGPGRKKALSDMQHVVEEVVSLRNALGYPTFEELASMVELGKIADTNLTKAMVLGAKKLISSANDPETMGKIKASPRPEKEVDGAAEKALSGDVTHDLHVDIMFTKSKAKNKMPVLIVYDSTFGHTNAVCMNSRSTKDVKAALDKMALYLEKYNVKVGVIHSDREGAFIELGTSSKYKFKYTAGPGTHEPMAERAIQTLKEIFRVKRSALPFKLPRSLYPKLLENVVMLTNYRLREGLTQTPDELLTGEKIRESNLIKGAFGRIALFKIPDEEVRIRKLDDLDDKAEYGVVVGMEHSNPKNLKVFLPMSTKAVVTRQGGKAAENIGQVIDAMNEIAREEEAAAAKKPAGTTEAEDEVDQSKVIHAIFATPPKPESRKTDPRMDESQASNAPPDVFGSDFHIDPGSMDRLSIKKAMQVLPEAVVKAAVIQELVTNMREHDVWDYKLPGDVKGKHILPSMLFIKVKTDPNGRYDKTKARLVPNGGLQTPDEYGRSSSPTVDFSSLSMLFGLVKVLKANLATVDVPAAYLNAPLKEKLYMRLDKTVSAILVEHDPNLRKFLFKDGTIVVLLKKCIYGLKQSGYEWHIVMVLFLLDILGFKQSSADRCVFFILKPSVVIIVVYVDDAAILYQDEKLYADIKAKLDERFGPMKFNEGKEHNYVGMHLQVMQDKSIFASQVGHINNLLTAYQAWRVKRDTNFKYKDYKTPSSSDLMELKAVQGEVLDVDLRKNVLSFVYSALYLATRTRPDVVFTVVVLASSVSNPPQDIVRHLDRLFGYLKSTSTRGVLYGALNTNLMYMADVAYAIHQDGKSHTGVIITMGGSPVSVKSSKQKIVTLSSTEAELEGAVSTLKTAQPIRRLLGELQLLHDPAVVVQDNKSTITIAKSGEGYSGKSKHFRVRYAAMAEQYANGEIVFEHLGTELMTADILSKPGGGPNFGARRDELVKENPELQLA